MTTKAMIKIEAEVEVTVEQLARAFCSWDAEQQAEFFRWAVWIVESEWDSPGCIQWTKIGEQLEQQDNEFRDAAQEMLRDIVRGFESIPITPNDTTGHGKA